MAASIAMPICGATLAGGVGPLPVRNARLGSGVGLASRMSPFSGRIFVRKVSRESSRRRYAVVCQQEEEGTEDSKVFRSMKDAAESRKEEMYGSLDALDIAKIVSDAELLSSRNSASKNKPPRFATLRAFGEAGGEGVITGFGGTSVFELLAASVEASKQVRNWEVLSGRLAMLALSIAVGVEFFTGDRIFEGVNVPELEGAAVLCAVATLAAASFAYAWRTKADVVSMMSRNYKTMMDSALDNIIDGVFFDESK